MCPIAIDVDLVVQVVGGFVNGAGELLDVLIRTRFLWRKRYLNATIVRFFLSLGKAENFLEERFLNKFHQILEDDDDAVFLRDLAFWKELFEFLKISTFQNF